MYRHSVIASVSSRKSTRAQCPTAVPFNWSNISFASSSVRIILIGCLCLHPYCLCACVGRMQALHCKIIREITEYAELPQADRLQSLLGKSHCSDLNEHPQKIVRRGISP